MHRLIIFMLLALFSKPLLAKEARDIYRSVLRIEVATQNPDYSEPWTTGRFSGGIGTGFIIGPNKILTNAHVVSNARRILITIYGSPKKYPARVEHIAHDCDLALLTLEDFSELEAFHVFEFGDVPKLESQVRVIGYPIGGDRLSVTRGVVSRIDFQPYAHTRVDSHLTVQIDAAINPGNSGGPVLQNESVVGVAFQGLTQADNTGYIIPTPVIRRFLKDVEDGTYDHYTDLGINTFPLFNQTMRQALKLADNNSGVLVRNVVPQSSADGALQAGDVIVSLDGNEVDSAGMVNLDGENVNLNEIIERKFTGDKVAVRFLREQTWNDIEITLKPLVWARMYSIQYEKNPRFVAFAGLVFQPLDTNLFAARKFEDLHVRRFYSDYTREGLFIKHPDIVILTRVESDSVTSRLDGYAGLAVHKINGTEVKDLQHARDLLYPKEAPEFFIIECFGGQRPIIIAAADVEAANQRMKDNYDMPDLENLTE